MSLSKVCVSLISLTVYNTEQLEHGMAQLTDTWCLRSAFVFVELNWDVQARVNGRLEP